MFSELRARPIACLATATVILVALGACGRKGDPRPPPQKNPAQINDLSVEQRGQELILSMGYPTMTQGGLALAGIDKLELVQYTRPAPEFSEQPEELACPGAFFQAVLCWLDSEESAAGEDVLTEEVESSLDESPESQQAPDDVEEERTDESTGRTVEASADDETDAAGETTEGDDTEAPEGDEIEDVDTDADQQPFLPIIVPNPFLAIRVDRRDFDKHAETLVQLEGPDIDAAVVGGTIFIRIPLAEIATEPPVAYSFAVETSAGRLRSPMSRITSFVPLPPPPAPTELTAEPGANGITLTWRGLEDESMIEGYRVLRRFAQGPLYLEPLVRIDTRVEFEPGDATEPGRTDGFGLTDGFGGIRDSAGVDSPDGSAERDSTAEPQESTAEANSIDASESGAEPGSDTESDSIDELEPSLEPGVYEYLDRSAQFNHRYVYTVTALRMFRPLVESALAEEQEVRYRDTFAPETPQGLISLAESGRIRLLWDAGRERDIAGYLVFVKAGAGETQQLTPEPVDKAEFIHEGTVTGITYVYTVQAVDEVGNSSELSAEVSTRAP